MLKYYKYYQGVFSELEKVTGEWSIVQVQQSIPIFNSIVNLTQRTSTIMNARSQTEVVIVLHTY
jgi:hypothetical protein